MFTKRLVLVFAIVVVIIITLAYGVSNLNKSDVTIDFSGQWILFSCGYFSNDFDTSHVYSIRPDGTELQQISSGKLVAINPNWSTNSHTISFFSDNQLFVLNPEGLDSQEIFEFTSANSHTIQSADLHPDDDILVIGTFSGSIISIDFTTGEKTLLLDQVNPIRSVRWSHDGEKVAFTTQSPSTINLIDPETLETSRISSSNLLIGDLDWSIDDRYLYVTLYNAEQGRSMHVIEVDNGNLSTSETPDNYYDSPTISPSGEEFIYVGVDEFGSFQLYKTDQVNNVGQQLTTMSCNVSSPRWYNFETSDLSNS